MRLRCGATLHSCWLLFHIPVRQIFPDDNGLRSSVHSPPIRADARPSLHCMLLRRAVRQRQSRNGGKGSEENPHRQEEQSPNLKDIMFFERKLKRIRSLVLLLRPLMSKVAIISNDIELINHVSR